MIVLHVRVRCTVVLSYESTTLARCTSTRINMIRVQYEGTKYLLPHKVHKRVRVLSGAL